MIVTCESCQARFRLDDGKVGPEGARVRCSKCSHTFVVMPEPSRPVTISASEVSSLDEDDTKVMAGGPGTDDIGIAVEIDGDPTAPDPGQAPTRNLREEARAAVGELESPSIHQMETKVHSIRPPGATEAAAVQEPPVGAEDPFASSPALTAPPSHGGLEQELFADVVAGDEGGAGAVSLSGSDPPSQPFAPMSPEATAPAGGDEPHPSLSTKGAAVVYMSIVAAGLLLAAGLVWLVAPGAARNVLYGERLVLPGEGDVDITSAHAVLFPTRSGKALVVTGEVANRGAQAVSNPYVVVELRAPRGAVQAEAQGPVGIQVTPPQLRELEGADSLRRLWQQIAAGSRTLPPGASQPFSVVFLPAPASPSEQAYHLRVTSGEPIPALPPPEPAPEAVTGAQDPGDQAAELESDEDDKGKKKKGKPKRKTKRTKRKGKRKS